jgi:ribosomal protein L37AE/L43A
MNRQFMVHVTGENLWKCDNCGNTLVQIQKNQTLASGPTDGDFAPSKALKVSNFNPKGTSHKMAPE